MPFQKASEKALILWPSRDPVAQTVQPYTGFNHYDWTYHFRLAASESVLTQGSTEEGTISGDATLLLLNLTPSFLPVVYLSLC